MIRGSRKTYYCGVANFEDNLDKYLRGEVNVINYPCDRWSNFIEFIYIFLKSYVLLPNLTLILHEYSNFRVKKYLIKILCYLPGLKIIVSSDLEKNLLKLKKVIVIDIPSNIKISCDLKATELRFYDFVYFGQIAPNKGIEAYIKLKKLCADKYKFIFIGAEREEQKEYTSTIKNEFDINGIEYFLNLEEEKISHYLSDSKYAFYFLPKGIENKSGSVKACLEHKVIVFGNLNKDISKNLKKSIVSIESIDELIVKLSNDIYAVKEENFERISFKNYAKEIENLNSMDKR